MRVCFTESADVFSAQTGHSLLTGKSGADSEILIIFSIETVFSNADASSSIFCFTFVTASGVTSPRWRLSIENDSFCSRYPITGTPHSCSITGDSFLKRDSLHLLRIMPRIPDFFLNEQYPFISAQTERLFPFISITNITGQPRTGAES